MKKIYTGLRVEKISFAGKESILASSASSCTLTVMYTDNDLNGLCDEAEEDPIGGNFFEWWVGENGG